MFKSNSFTSLNKKTYIFAIILILAVTLAVLLKRGGGEENISPETQVSQETTGQPSRQAPSGSKVYEDAHFHFSFFYPETFSAGAFSDAENTKTVLIQDESKKMGVQIYISSFGEDITLTPERIKKDVPDIAMSDVKSISVGQGIRSDLKAGIPRSDLAIAVSFKSANSSGPTTEVWFVYKSNLYQISSPQPSSPDLPTPRPTLGSLELRSGGVLLDDIIKTWRWSK